MRAADVMSENVKRVAAGVPAAEAWELMRQQSIHHLVVMADGEVKGVVSDRDLGGRKHPDVRSGKKVADVMSTSVIAVDARTPVRRVANLMRGHTIGSVVVLDGGRLKGIVTVSDLLELIGRGIDRPAQPDRRNLHHRVAHRKHHGAGSAW